MYRNRYLVLSLTFLAVAVRAEAGVITADGVDLVSNSSVSFPSGSPTLDGTSLEFAPGPFTNHVLLRWDLFPANTLTSGSPATDLSITVNATRLTSEFDLIVALWDGTRFLGSTFGDNNGGAFWGNFGSWTGSGSLSIPFDNVDFTPTMFGVDQAGDFKLDFALGNGTTTMTASMGGVSRTSTGDFAGSSWIDRTKSLSLLVGLNEPSERVAINSVTVDSSLVSTSPVPEPSSLALLGMGAVGLLAARRRRKSTDVAA